jgi:hypothetical protein
MNKRKVWVEPLFAEAKDWHGMRRFRLRRLWRTNAEALMTAAGQNLKRLLQTRGWGRRPFPAEAVVSVPSPNQETDGFLRDYTLKSHRARVVGASLVSCNVIRAFITTQISQFSLVHVVLYPLSIFPFEYALLLFWSFPLISPSPRGSAARSNSCALS